MTSMPRSTAGAAAAAGSATIAGRPCAGRLGARAGGLRGLAVAVGLSAHQRASFRERRETKPAIDVEQHDDDDQCEGRSPGAVDVRGLGHPGVPVLVEGEDWQVRHPPGERVPVHRREGAGGDEQRGRLADDPRHGDHHARDDAGQGGREHDAQRWCATWARPGRRRPRGARSGRSSASPRWSARRSGSSAPRARRRPRRRAGRPDRGRCANRAYAKRPATIDGMPVMTSTKKISACLSRPCPYSCR